jgi:hypothetical protein
MKKFIKLIDTIRDTFCPKLKDAPSYFDYSSKERKKIIQDAAKGAIKMQKELEDKYNRYSKVV